MLECQARTRDLSSLCGAAQLRYQFSALCKACRTERMTLAEQAAGWIGDDPPAVRVISVIHEFLRTSDRAEADGFICKKLVVSKAIVQFDYVDILRSNACSFIHVACRRSRHAVTDHLPHVVRGKRRRPVGTHCLRAYAHAPVETLLGGETCGTENRSGSAAGRRTGHQECHDARPQHR